MTEVFEGEDMRGKSDDSESDETYKDVEMTGVFEGEDMRGKSEDSESDETSKDVQMTGMFEGEDKRGKSQDVIDAHQTSKGVEMTCPIFDGEDMRRKSQDGEADDETYEDTEKTGRVEGEHMRGKRQDVEAHETYKDVGMAGPIFDGEDMRRKSQNGEADEASKDAEKTGMVEGEGMRGKSQDVDAHETSKGVEMTGISHGEEMRSESEFATYERAQEYISLVGGSRFTIKSQKEVERILWEANQMFNEHNWTAAVARYSDFIDLACGKLDYGLKNVAWEETFQRVVLSAYSKRAEASLRLRHYEDALWAVDRALQIDPKHFNTLIRKGRAAHHLGLFQKAYEVFHSALAISPGDQSLLKLIRKTIIAFQQSQTGEYDLTDFFSSGCRGEIPSCADFVGPVEIRRARCVDGRRGLFATKSLEPGELLIVSNPLAVFRRKPVNPIAGSREGFPKKFFEELFGGIEGSKRQMARLYSLGSKCTQEMQIPSMELFRPGSEWIPPSAVNLAVDLDYIADITRRKNFHYVDAKGAKEEGHTEVIGLWILPAFASHSCAPNCQHSFVGDTIFFRASGHIMEGEELTVSYFTNLFEDVKSRQATSKDWMFICKCERCRFEECLAPQMCRINTVIDFISGAAVQNFRRVRNLQEKQWAQESALKELAKATHEVEVVILSLGTAISHKQQGWIRAAFMSFYMAALRVPEVSVWSLKLIIDSMMSVYVTPGCLELAAELVRDVFGMYTSFGQFYQHTADQVLGMYRVYQHTEDQVLGIYRVYFGNLDRRVLSDLVTKNLPELSKTGPSN